MDEGYTIRRHVIRSCDSLRVVHETKVSVSNDDYLTLMSSQSCLFFKLEISL